MLKICFAESFFFTSCSEAFTDRCNRGSIRPPGGVVLYTTGSYMYGVKVTVQNHAVRKRWSQNPNQTSLAWVSSLDNRDREIEDTQEMTKAMIGCPGKSQFMETLFRRWLPPDQSIVGQTQKSRITSTASWLVFCRLMADILSWKNV